MRCDAVRILVADFCIRCGAVRFEIVRCSADRLKPVKTAPQVANYLLLQGPRAGFCFCESRTFRFGADCSFFNNTARCGADFYFRKPSYGTARCLAVKPNRKKPCSCALTHTKLLPGRF